MQCKDIPDALVVAAVQACAVPYGARWAQCWDVWPWLERHAGALPQNLYWAKMRSVIRRGIIRGCPCTCRGDYHLKEDCVMGCCR
jgi:hypothetical protein